MKFNTSHVRQYQVAIITLVVLTAIFLLYYFVFAQEKKEYVHERAFRILNQNTVNLQEKNRNTITNARQEISYRNAIDSKEPLYTRLFIDAQGRTYTSPNPNTKAETVQIDRLKKSNTNKAFPIIFKNLLIDSTGQAFKKHLNMPIAGRFNRQLEFTGINKYANHAISHSQLEEIAADYWVTYRDTVHVVQLNDTSIYLQDSLRMEFRIKFRDFIKDCLIGEGEVFDGYQIFTGNNLVYSTIPGELTAFTKDKIYGRDSIVKSAGNIHDVEIAGISYKLFVQKINIGHTKNLVLGGLITKKSYRAQIYQVSMFTVLFSLLLMLVLILGYPFLKLLIMSRNERLKSGDAFFCAFSMIVGSFMVILIALSSYIYLVPEQKVYNENLKKLSNDIENEFIKELTSIYKQLEVYKSIPGSQIANQSNILQNNGSQQYPAIYPYFDNVFWIDGEGNPRATWQTRRFNQPYVKVASRQYFKRVMEGRTWNLDTTKPFMLEPVFNRISGENMAVMSIPLDPEPKNYTFKDTLRPVLAVAVSLHSVINAVMPLGYGFCILDKQGHTWFHSDRQKNLQEQFLKESGENRELMAALNGSAPRHINLTYNGQKYLAYSIPLRQLPLSLIVFHKEDYFKSIRTMSISVSIMYYLLALLPLCFLLIVHKATFNHDPRIHGENFAFRWLSPRNKKLKQYQLLTFVLAGLIIVDILMFFLHRNEKDLWLMYVFTIISSFAAARMLLYNNTYSSLVKTLAFWAVYSIMSIAIFVGTAEQWITNENQQLIKAIIVLGMLIVLAGLFLLLRFKTSKWRSELSERYIETHLKVMYPVSILVWVVLLGILPALAFYKINYNREQRIAASHHLVQSARDLTNRGLRIEEYYRNIRRSDTDTTVSSLVKARGIYHHAGAKITFHKKTDATADTIKDNKFTDLIPRYRLRPLYNAIVTENHLLLKPADKPGYWHWTSGLPNDSLALHFFEYNFSLSDTDYPLLSTGLPSFKPFYLIANWFHDSLLLLLGLAAILFIFYGLIRYAAIYLFNFIILEELSYRSATNKILSVEDIKEWAGKEQNRMFLSGVSLPPSRDFRKLIKDTKMEYINLEIISGNIHTMAYEIDKDNIDDNIIELITGSNGANSSAVQANNTEDPATQKAKKTNAIANKVFSHRTNQFLHSPDKKTNKSHQTAAYETQANSNQDKSVTGAVPAKGVANKKYNKVIITHFEQIINWAMNEEKYQAVTSVLYQLIEKADSVLIFSLKDLHEINERIQKSVQMPVKKEEKNVSVSEEKIWKVSTHDNWENLLGGFQERRFHMDTFTGLANGPQNDATDQKEWKKELINSECEGFGWFLSKLKNEMLNNTKEYTRGGIILRIQQLARLHYTTLWKSCTREEQYVLYDLAQDGLANSKNMQAITALLEKGLLIYDGTIRIMNRSFRNYILTTVQPHEGLTIEREITAKGPWSEFKTVLILVISAIIAFIFATQRETYDQIIAVITTFTASIPLLLKLLGSINFNRSKPAE